MKKFILSKYVLIVGLLVLLVTVAIYRNNESDRKTRELQIRESMKNYIMIDAPENTTQKVNEN